MRLRTGSPPVRVRPVPVLLITSAKGGTGKTTITAALVGAAMAVGADVVVADVDPQGGALRLLGPDLVTHLPYATTTAVKALRGRGKHARRIVLVDSPPGLVEGATGAVGAADAVLAVLGPGWPDMATMPALERWVDLDAVVGCRFDMRRRLHRSAAEHASDRYGPKWLGVLPARAEVEEAAAECRPLIAGSAPAVAATEIWAALQALLNWKE